MRYKLLTSIMFVLLVVSIAMPSGGAEVCVANVEKVKQLLNEKRYEELTGLLEVYANNIDKDIQCEFALLDMFNVFNDLGPEYNILMDEWVQKNAGHWIPLISRATYYDGLGWKARGAQYAKDTSEDKFKEMARYLNISLKDIKSAINAKDNVFYPYYLMMKINRSSGNQKVGDILVKKALTISPSSYLIRRQHLQLLLPRWGGSHEAMESFINESLIYIDNNIHIGTLKGLIDWDKASNYNDEGKYDLATEYYKKSLSHGDTWNTLYDMADNYYRNKQYEKAYDTISIAISKYNNLPDRYILSAPNLKHAMNIKEYCKQKIIK